jgi:hypothetical protein
MKLALLIGINYTNTRYELSGCINDAQNLSNMLVHTMGYDPESIVILSDDQSGNTVPTKQNIIEHLKSMIRRTRVEHIEEVWFSYSGHGVQREDVHSEESDRIDECLLPEDYKDHGVIRDDVLHSLFAEVSVNTTTRVLIDACHSGSMLDLPYRYDDDFVPMIENRRSVISNPVYMISGCMDNQTSSDAVIQSVPQGAMTRSFLHSLEQGAAYDITWFRLLQNMRLFLKSRKFNQIPQFSCSGKVSKDTIFYS